MLLVSGTAVHEFAPLLILDLHRHVDLEDAATVEELMNLNFFCGCIFLYMDLVY